MIKKQNTKAERISWMTRTSDVVGSFHSTTPEACTTLIRRKIQERCGSTQDLMTAIRRMKTGNTGHVTPNEFRLTLLKFGIIVPQHQLEQIFNIFDSDRSGTIDFDEFAMWIMNSEFHPVSINHQAVPKANKEELLRSRLKVCYQNYPNEFASLKPSIDFLYLLSFCHKKNIPLTDAEIRQVFTTLDPSNTGLIDSDKLRRFALHEGSNRQLPVLNTETSKPDLAQSIVKVCGALPSQVLINCFGGYNADSRLDFPTFSRCLKTGQLGDNNEDFHNLFRALGGNENTTCSLRPLYDRIPESAPTSSSVSSQRQLRPLKAQKVNIIDSSIECSFYR